MQEHPATIGARLTHALERHLKRLAPRMNIVNVCAFVLAAVLSILAMSTMNRILATYDVLENVTDSFDACERSVTTLQEASDYLTTQARLYVNTGKQAYLDNYINELEIKKSRQSAVQALREQATNSVAIQALENAERHSNELALTELYAMKLSTKAENEKNLPAAVANVSLSESDAALSYEERHALADEMVNGEDYLNKKMLINEGVYICSNTLMNDLRASTDTNNALLNDLLTRMRIIVVLLLLLVGFIVVSTFYLVLWPMSRHVKDIIADKSLTPSGASELRYLIDAYNEMYEERYRRTRMLQQEAETDGLTSLLNRGAFETLIGSCMRDIALILVDVDYFKQFNDNFGHDMGDAVLIEVAATLLDAFRTADYVCRIGGDEFAVIMTEVDTSMRPVVIDKLESITAFLRDTENGLPSVTISVGIAFDTELPPGEELFHFADQALYATKKSGRDGYTFAGELGNTVRNADKSADEDAE